jgi:iron complex transport system permease protein
MMSGPPKVDVQQPESQAAGGAASGRGSRKLPIVVIVLCFLLLVEIFAATCIGAVTIRPAVVASVLLHQHMEGISMEQAIIFQIRLPRVLAAALVGCALSIAGVLFQGLFRNPMADPYVIGTSGGAALGATLGVVLLPHLALFGFGASALLAFFFSLATMVAVYWLARVGGRTPIVTLLLAGLALGAMLGYSTTFVLLVNPEKTLAVRLLTAWLHGAISNAEWSEIALVGVMVLLGSVLSLPLARSLNALCLGDEYAQQLGIRVEFLRAAIIIIGSLLTAAAVSLGGLIGFVGLVVPHLVRLLIGPDHFRLLPIAGLAGAIFLILADTLARTVLSPSELPVGILTAFIGGPVFLFLLRRSKREYAL